MTGQIPRYGTFFKHDRVGAWHPTLNDAIYIFRENENWFIRANKGSKSWRVYRGADRNTAIAISDAVRTMSMAMELLENGADLRYYDMSIDGNVHMPNCGLQGSGLDKKCTCHVDYNGQVRDHA